MDIIRKEVSDCLHLLFCITIEDWYLMTLSAPKFGATLLSTHQYRPPIFFLMEGIRIWKFKVRQCIILHASNQLIGFGTYIYAWRHSYISYATQRSLMKHAAAQTRVLREHGHRRSWGGHKRHLGPKISSMSMQGLLWTLASCCIMQLIPFIVATAASVSTH